MGRTRGSVRFEGNREARGKVMMRFGARVLPPTVIASAAEGGDRARAEARKLKNALSIGQRGLPRFYFGAPAGPQLDPSPLRFHAE